MALRIIFFHLCIAVAAVNLIFADEDSDSLGFFSNFQLPSFFNFGSRQERSADDPEPEEEESEPQDRLASIISCNYTSQGGTACSSCRQALACYPNNVGRLRTCSGLLRYCNNGRCSFIPGAECRNSTG